MQGETRFKIKVLSFLRSLPHTWVVKIQQVAIRGTPDILGVISGHFIALELKSADSGIVSPLQAHNLQEIADAGGISLVVTPENWFKMQQTLRDLAYGFHTKVS